MWWFHFTTPLVRLAAATPQKQQTNYYLWQYWNHFYARRLICRHGLHRQLSKPARRDKWLQDTRVRKLRAWFCSDTINIIRSFTSQLERLSATNLLMGVPHENWIGRAKLNDKRERHVLQVTGSPNSLWNLIYRVLTLLDRVIGSVLGKFANNLN